MSVWPTAIDYDPSAKSLRVTFDSGEQFDASWDRGDPLEFRLGVGMVIQGWDEGMAGMKVGGRRRLTIPAHKAYGERDGKPMTVDTPSWMASVTKTMSATLMMELLGQGIVRKNPFSPRRAAPH